MTLNERAQLVADEVERNATRLRVSALGLRGGRCPTLTRV